MTNIAYAALALAAMLIPGVAAVWAYERRHEVYSRKASDWLFRLTAISAAILGLLALPLYRLMQTYWDDFRNLKPLPWWLLAFAPSGYLLASVALGALAARLGRPAEGNRIAPNAWAHLFQREKTGIVRCRLKSGRWVGGVYDRDSYASAQGPKRDIYISRAVQLTDEGTILRTDDGEPLWAGSQRRCTGLLVKWDDVETLEFTPLNQGDSDGSRPQGIGTL